MIITIIIIIITTNIVLPKSPSQVDFGHYGYCGLASHSDIHAFCVWQRVIIIHNHHHDDDDHDDDDDDNDDDDGDGNPDAPGLKPTNTGKGRRAENFTSSLLSRSISTLIMINHDYNDND